MTWNYRVLMRPGPHGGGEYWLCEVYYDDAGQPAGYVTDGVTPRGWTLAELLADLEHMREATSAPILEEAALDAACEANPFFGARAREEGVVPLEEVLAELGR